MKGDSLIKNLARTSDHCIKAVPWIRRRGFDLVIPTDGRGIISWSVPTRVAGKKLVYHHQATGAGPLVKRAASLSHVLITISEYNDMGLPKKLRKRSIVVPNAVVEPTIERSRARQEIRNLLGIEEDQVVIGFVANMIKRKRPFIFVEIAGKLRSPSRTFPMFGNPENKETLMNLKQRALDLGVERSLPMPGFVPDIRNMMMGLDILVAPQVDEGFGLNVAEAMAAGVAVVASNSGAHPEFIDHEKTGLLVEPDDVEAFTAAVSRLLEDRALLEAIGSEGRLYVREHHSLQDFGDAFHRAIMV